MIGIFPMKAADTCLTETMLERENINAGKKQQIQKLLYCL